MMFMVAVCFALGSAPASILVDTHALAAMDEAVPVDARSLEAFEDGHIPGAAHLDVESLSEERDGVSGLLKPMPAVLALLAGAGLDPAQTLVVYSGLESEDDVKRATRLFWVLEYAGFSEVRLLDGGLAKWKAEGRPLGIGPSAVKPVAVSRLAELKTVAARQVVLEDVRRASDGKQGLVVDFRDTESFTGASKSKSVPRAGRIPGAKSSPADQFFEGPYFTFKSPDALRAILDADPSQPVIAYCNTGRVASVGYVAYRIAGVEQVALYDGSMSEWGAREDCPVATGSGE